MYSICNRERETNRVCWKLNEIAVIFIIRIYHTHFGYLELTFRSRGFNDKCSAIEPGVPALRVQFIYESLLEQTFSFLPKYSNQLNCINGIDRMACWETRTHLKCQYAIEWHSRITIIVSVWARKFVVFVELISCVQLVLDRLTYTLL